MSYSITVTDASTGKKELFEGDNVDSVHKKISKKLFRIRFKGHQLTKSESKKFKVEINREIAAHTTDQFQKNIQLKKQLLKQSSNSHIKLWQYLKNEVQSEFIENMPELKSVPIEPSYEKIPPKPKRSNKKYNIKKTLLDGLFSKNYKLKMTKVQNQFESDIKNWEEKKANIENKNKELQLNYSKNLELINVENESKVNEWKNRKTRFEENQEKALSSIEELKGGYLKKEVEAIESYNLALLKHTSTIKDLDSFECELAYNQSNKILLVDYMLPDTDSTLTVSEIKYIASKDVFEEHFMNKKDFSDFYNESIHQLTLSVIDDIFTNDKINVIETVVFNGFVKTVDKSTGKEISPYIISVLVSKEEFSKLNLKQVDARACIKKLKGVSASDLAAQTPIAPVIKIDKNDKRFIESKDITDSLTNTMNLAAMDWEDFEHLVRELFEKEFSKNGGEVKVTRASRDGGVDAIAFDPDPLRGGKIVIQAKRYTNTVGVSAVRDLYGTLMNEGATKGILVTTSDYGSDAYNFAKGKPLTLLNGSNLLYLLEQHGHKAIIDLGEAKKILGID